MTLKNCSVLIVLLIQSWGIAQMAKNELPREILIEKTESSPSNISLSSDRMIYQSDSTLHYGFQHTVTYDMNWTSDSTFNLTLVKHVTVNNNPGIHVKRKRKIRKSSKSYDDFFQLSRYHNWYWEDLGNCEYKLNTYEESLVRMTFVKQEK